MAAGGGTTRAARDLAPRSRATRNRATRACRASATAWRGADTDACPAPGCASASPDHSGEQAAARRWPCARSGHTGLAPCGGAHPAGAYAKHGNRQPTRSAARPAAAIVTTRTCAAPPDRLAAPARNAAPPHRRSAHPAPPAGARSAACRRASPAAASTRTRNAPARAAQAPSAPSSGKTSRATGRSRSAAAAQAGRRAFTKTRALIRLSYRQGSPLRKGSQDSPSSSRTLTLLPLTRPCVSLRSASWAMRRSTAT